MKNSKSEIKPVEKDTKLDTGKVISINKDGIKIQLRTGATLERTNKW